MIYISHKLEEVFELADRVTVLRDGRYIGTRETAATSSSELIQMMVGRELTDLFPKEDADLGGQVIDIRNLSLQTPPASAKRNLHDISFAVSAGEVVGVAGLMGSGRTELLETIFGVHPAAWRSGTIVLEGVERRIRNPNEAIESGLAFVTEDRKTQSLFMGLPVGNNITMAALGSLSRFGIVQAKLEWAAVAAAITSMRIRTSTPRIEVDKLSGGNQQKVALSKSLMTRPRLLLLDEPTRGIDIGAKAEIYALISQLAKGGAGVLMASSELPELIAMCDRIIVLSEGRLAATLDAKSTTQTQIMEAATSRINVPEAQSA
jgi:ribose transport system ATP-binding protein